MKCSVQGWVVGEDLDRVGHAGVCVGCNRGVSAAISVS